MEDKRDFFYIDKLEITDFKCFKEKQELQFDNENNKNRWTIILGDNATGKTTVLKILDTLYIDEFEVDEKSNIYFPKFLNGNRDFVKESDIIGKTELKIYLKNSEGKTLELNYLDSASYNDDLNTFLLSYGASRRMSKNPNFSSSRNAGVNSLFDQNVELINVEEWYFKKDYELQITPDIDKPKVKKQLDLIKKILIDFLPEVLDLRTNKVKDKKNIQDPDFVLEVQINENEWISLRDLSFGYQTITALLVDIAANMMTRYRESENPLHEPVIILIDEIDLHLHPKWQRTVIDKLTEHFPKAQFIVTAHSPLIAQAAEDKNANIVVCRKEGDKIVIDNSPESVKGWRVDQILTSELFDVGSSRSKSTQDHIDEYIKLKGRENLNPEQSTRLEELTLIVGEAYSKNTNQELDKKLQYFANRFLK